MTKEFESTCPNCGKPITTVKGKIPKHEIKVVRNGVAVPVKCPGTGKRPN